MPIGQKMSILYSSVFFLMLFAVSVIMLFYSLSYYQSISKSEINDVFDTIESYISKNGRIDYRAINEIVNNKYIEIIIFDNSGKFLEGGMHPPELPNENNYFRPDIREHHFNIEMIKDIPYMVVEKEIVCNNNTYIIKVFRQYSKEHEVIKFSYILFLVENILAIGLSLILSKWITNKLLKPVKDITNAAEKISVEDLSQRISVPEAKDELQDLAITFNEMIERLEISFEKQNQFISDASHELKTPISVIQGYANLIDRWGKSDETVLNESITSIKSETEHMTNIIKQLLFLAKNDANQPVNLESINLEFIVSEISKEINVLEVKTDFSYEVDENVIIKADYHLIKQLIWIFIENAVKYSGNKESKIFLKAYKNESVAFISIKDNGIGIDKENIDKIFERFYRADKSRNKEIPGVGLGLSIAKWIVSKHKGTIKVDSVIGEGTEFIIEIPLDK